jgi:hypothetical protein
VARELRQVLEHAHVRLLHHVFGLVVVQHEGRAKQALIVTPGELFEVRRAAGSDRVDQGLIGRGRRVFQPLKR